MNPAESLPLRDIHLPDAVSWWPPAIGWWILFVLGLLLLAGLILGIRKLLQPRLNKSARAEIEQVLNEYYAEHADDLKMLQQLSSAIRRIGISYLSREQYAGVVGTVWYQRINQLAPEQAFTPAMVALLVDAPYQKQPHIDAELVQQLVAQARRWVQALPANPSTQIQRDAAHV